MGQRVFQFVTYFIAGVLILGAVLDARTNASTLSNVEVIVWAAILISIWVALELWARSRYAFWRTTSGVAVSVKRLGLYPRLALLGSLVLLGLSRVPVVTTYFDITRTNARLEWRTDETGGLRIAVMAEESQTLRDVSIDVIDIRRQSDQGDFVEVPELHQAGRFETFSIGAGFFSDVYPDRPLVLPFLRTGDDKKLRTWRVVARDSREILEALEIPGPGIWRITFGNTNRIHLEEHYLYFQWVNDAAPKPWSPRD